MNHRLDRHTVGFLLHAAGVDAWGVAAHAPAPAPELPRAISIMMRVRPATLCGVEHGPTHAYLAEYHRLNAALDEATATLVTAIEEAGHAAVAVPATQSGGRKRRPLPHKTAATRAGLGWIGKTALFVSSDLGPAVRLATVFTDLPLSVSRPIDSGACGECRRCVEACPAGAGRDVTWQAGMPREELFDADACRRHMARAHTGALRDVCGICIAVCPRSSP